MHNEGQAAQDSRGNQKLFGGGTINEEIRETKWNEMGIEQKLEALRRVARENAHILQLIVQQVQNLRDETRMLDRHSHSPNGEVFVPLGDQRYRGNPTPTMGGNYDPLA